MTNIKHADCGFDPEAFGTFYQVDPSVLSDVGGYNLSHVKNMRVDLSKLTADLKISDFNHMQNGVHYKLIAANMRQSMSRVGRCIDNGPMEGFWGILKSEMYYLRKFTSRDDLISAIERYLHFYNNKRYQQRLRCMTPMEFHRTAA